jgi:hypothetical protein
LSKIFYNDILTSKQNNEFYCRTVVVEVTVELFHGSNIEIKEPRIIAPARALDFGAGFYTTSSFQQATRWANIQERRRKNGVSIVSHYEFEIEKAKANFSVLEFSEPDGEWLDFVIANRKEQPIGRRYDLVIGPVANDNTLPVLDDYMDGRYTKEEAVARLLPQKLVDQFAFLTQIALAYLHFIEDGHYGNKID